MSAVFDDALAALEADPSAAFQKLRDLLKYPSKLAAKDWGHAFALFREIASALGDDSALGEALKRGAATPEDTKVLFEIGFQLIEQGLFDISASVLARANELQPGVETLVNELAFALEQDMRNAEAVEILRSQPALTENPTVSRYLLAFHSIMTGDLETPRELYPALLASDEEGISFMGAALAAMLGRADAIAGTAPLDGSDLRGWHFVLNGALLLHLSPHGLDEPMRGRYAWVQDSNAVIHEGIRRLAVALEALGQTPERVFALPERGSQIVAHVAARILGVPLVEWTPGTESPGLIAVYDLEHLDGDTLVSVADHRAGQIVWAHAVCWTHDPPFCPDLSTMLYQSNTAPWAGQLIVDPASRESTKAPVSIAPVEHHVEQILAAALEDEQLADLEVLRTFASQMKSAKPNALKTEGRRGRQWLGSPVASARFA